MVEIVFSQNRIERLFSDCHQNLDPKVLKPKGGFQGSILTFEGTCQVGQVQL